MLYDKVVSSPNYSVGRNGSPVRYIVFHTTEGTGLGSLAWLTNPASQVSAHYLIMEDGEIVLMVDETDRAWHAGIIVGTPTTPYYTGTWEDIYQGGVLIGGGWTVNPNDESIGIEVAGYAVAPIGPGQMMNLVALVKSIRSRYGNIPVVGHYELSPGNRSDPGVYNLEWLKRELATEDDVFTDADKQWILDNVKKPLEDKLQSGFNTTLSTFLDRQSAGDKKVITPEVDS